MRSHALHCHKQVSPNLESDRWFAMTNNTKESSVIPLQSVSSRDLIVWLLYSIFCLFVYLLVDVISIVVEIDHMASTISQILSIVTTQSIL